MSVTQLPVGTTYHFRVNGIDLSCEADVSWTIDMGRDDAEGSCEPGRLSITLHKYGMDRAAWITPRAQVQFSITLAGVDTPVFAGRVAQVSRAFSWTEDGRASNDVRIDCVGPLAELGGAALPMGPDGAFQEMPDGWRVAVAIASAFPHDTPKLSLVRPASGHMVNDEFPAHASRWNPQVQYQTTTSGPIKFTRTTTLPALNKDDDLEVQIAFVCDHACMVRIDINGNTTNVRYSTPGTHTVDGIVRIPGGAPSGTMTLTFIPLDTKSSTTLRWSEATTNWDGWTPPTQTWVMPGLSSPSMTVSLLTVDVWKRTWDVGTVMLTRREPVEQSVLEHIRDIEDTGVGVLWETRDGLLSYQSIMTRKNQAPAIDLDACYVKGETESDSMADSLINDVEVAYDYDAMDGDGNSLPRPTFTRTDLASVALYGKQSRSIAGPIRDLASAQAIADYLLRSHAFPRERVSSLETLPLSKIPEVVVRQLLTAPLGSMVQVKGTPGGWLVAGTWAAFLEGFSMQGEVVNGVPDATMTLRLSDYRDSPYNVSLPNLAGAVADGDKPPMGHGTPGPAGPQGASLTVLGAVANVGDLPTVGNSPGDIHYVSSVGDLYVWVGGGTTGAAHWANMGHVSGPPGPQGIQGVQGAQGIPGPRGDGIHIKGSVANQAALPATGNTVGDTWVLDNNGNLAVWGNGKWDILPSIRGPQGAQGIQGIQGVQGAPGPAGAGIRIMSAVPTWTDLPLVANNPGDAHLVVDRGDLAVWDGTAWQSIGHIQGPVGPQGVQGQVGPEGPRGPMGAGVHILSAVATAADLPTTGNTDGDAHLVIADGNLHIWDGSTWHSIGHIVGPPGPAGIQGLKGDKGDGVDVFVQVTPPLNPKQGTLWVVP